MNVQTSKTCPHCGGTVAASVRVCYCGYDFFPQAVAQTAPMPTQSAPDLPGTSTETKRDVGGGVAMGCFTGSVLGIGMILVGTLLCFTVICALIGVPMILYGFASFFMGPLLGGFSKKMSTFTGGVCPYCAGKILVGSATKALTCPECKQRVLIRDGRFLQLPQ